MVSKSNTLGKSTIIFVTVGTTQFQFNRLFKTLNTILIKLNSKATLIAQYGTSTYLFDYKKTKQFAFLTPQELISYIQKADKIITHGGIGSIHTISQHSDYMPLTVARLKDCHEHVNDHQKDFLEYIKKKFPSSYHQYFLTDLDLETQIETFLIEPSKKNLFGTTLFSKQNNTSLLDNLDNYIKEQV